MVLGTEVKPIAGIAIASSGASSACVEDGGSPAGPHLVPSEHRHASAAASAVSTAAAIPVSEPAASGVAERHTARRVASELCAAPDRVSHADDVWMFCEPRLALGVSHRSWHPFPWRRRGGC